MTVVLVIHRAVGAAAAAAADHRVAATAVAPEVVTGETRGEEVTAPAVHHPARRGLDLPARTTHGRGAKSSQSEQDLTHLNLIVDHLVTSKPNHLNADNE